MLDAIAARRSIRKFKNTPVPRHIIEEIIKAGALAPSSKKQAAVAFCGNNQQSKRRSAGRNGTWTATRSTAAAFARKRAVYSRCMEHRLPLCGRHP